MPQRNSSGFNNHSRNSRQKPLGRAAGQGGGFGRGRAGSSGSSSGKPGFGKRPGSGRPSGSFGGSRSSGSSEGGRSDRGYSRFSGERSDSSRSDSSRSDSFRSSSDRPRFGGKPGFGRSGAGRPSDRPRFGGKPGSRFGGSDRPRYNSDNRDSQGQDRDFERRTPEGDGNIESQGSRPERSFRKSDRSDRFDRSDRPNRGFKRSDDRSDRGFGRSNNRFDRSSRDFKRSDDRFSRSDDRSERSERSEGADNPERSDRSDRFNRSDRPSRGFNRSGGRFDRPDRGFGRSDDRSGRFDRSDRSDRSDRGFGRSDDRPGRFDRSDRSERPERSFGRSDDRPGRFDRSDRFDRRDSDRSSDRRFGRSDDDSRREFRPRKERDPDYYFFHPGKEKKFDPAHPSGVEGEEERAPYVFESVKTDEEPRGRNMTVGFSPNDSHKRTRRPLKRYTDGTAEGRQARKEQMSQDSEVQASDNNRELPAMKYRAKAEKRTPRGLRSKKASSDDEGSSGIRLQKILASAGLGSRRNCEELITAGRVDVDGETVNTLGACVQPGQKIRVDGEAINPGKRHYFVLNKPEKFICSNADPDGRPRALDLIREHVDGLFAVGRLDMNSKGLLLITNDGELAFRLTHPSWEVQKVYRVHVSGVPSREIIRKMCEGIYIAEGKVHADKAKVHQTYANGTSTLEMVLSEGKNREIRRILAQLGHNVLDLTRVAIGPIKLGALPMGAYRRLNTSEVRELKQLVGLR